MVFDEVSCATFLLLAVSLAKCVFLGRNVAVFSHRNHDYDKDQNHCVKKAYQSEDHIRRGLKEYLAQLEVNYASDS
jgi:hypothetical protein